MKNTLIAIALASIAFASAAQVSSSSSAGAAVSGSGSAFSSSAGGAFMGGFPKSSAFTAVTPGGQAAAFGSATSGGFTVNNSSINGVQQPTTVNVPGGVTMPVNPIQQFNNSGAASVPSVGFGGFRR